MEIGMWMPNVKVASRLMMVMANNDDGDCWLMTADRILFFWHLSGAYYYYYHIRDCSMAQKITRAKTHSKLRNCNETEKSTSVVNRLSISLWSLLRLNPFHAEQHVFELFIFFIIILFKCIIALMHIIESVVVHPALHSFNLWALPQNWSFMHSAKEK